ncbi:hypothetical protein A3C18_01230 [Candidatus Kaiserbacteria bacterium RIFCSPHIGHO2_02_FULL_54_11b]|uniref:Uncharacterized protein n=2 Tax=Candidatus Kaiseribacteriota TaxID=1752734 RepID=A0A1F6CKJ3_9BACT|nr:MAG: hypothetical protein A2704_04470 [Candidatus Kaiserbacteria bacterium RIFCSPHIGHO2_01_FULL_54_36b]OGG64832.1 MAG: hypothetical protein A3C18_01230 [Candidatus Kaiserbacteria bacterium RIFCSPHIGHO2_02_FULL_54_11b]
MNRNQYLIVAVFALITLTFLTLLYVYPRAETPNGSGRVMRVESYISQNISDLSPEKEVLGGKFYVTDIQTTGGKGVVHYEDGHIALVADFTYKTSGEKGIEITSFTVRPQ